MTVEELNERYRKALETVEKRQATIERHMIQAQKKLKVIRENGWNENDRYAFQGTPQYHDSYWAVCEYQDKLEDIKNATTKLEEAKAIAQNWKEKLQAAAVKESFFGEIPKVFRDLQANLIKEWDTWDFKRRAFLQEQYNTLGYREFMRKFKSSDYYFKDKTDVDIHKENEKDAKALIIDLYKRVIAITGEVTDHSNMRVGNGFNLNGIVRGREGTCKVESILAGGHNIQRLHVRVLTHRI